MVGTNRENREAGRDLNQFNRIAVGGNARVSRIEPELYKPCLLNQVGFV